MKIIYHDLNMKIKKGMIKSIEGQKPLSYVNAVHDQVAITANYIIQDYYLIFVEGHDYPEGFAVYRIDKAVIGSTKANKYMESLINDVDKLSKYGMLSIEQRECLDILLEQYYEILREEIM